MKKRHSRRPRFFIVRRAKLLWCRQFHRKWRRRVAILPVQALGLGYVIHCLKCGVKENDLTEFQKTILKGKFWPWVTNRQNYSRSVN